MMKKLYFFMAFLATTFYVSAQCTPDTTLQNTGIFPPAGSIMVGTKVQLPTANVGANYAQVIQVVIPVDTMIDTLGSSFPATVDSMVVTNVSGLPAGLQYSCDNSACSWEGGTNGCISLTGTPAAGTEGVHPITVDVIGYVVLFNIPLSGADVIGDFQILVDPTIGIREVEKDEVVAYPNPSAGLMHWRYPSNLEESVQIEIYNVQGSVVAEKSYEVVSGDNILDWNLSNLPNGVYTYMVKGSQDVHNGQLMLNVQ